MNEDFQGYINKVINNIGISGKRKKQIKEDLYASLIEKQEITGECNPYVLLGDPQEIAEEFRQNLGIKENTRYCWKCRKDYEYVSKIKVFGVPLVHINTKPLGIAKGIFSYGSIAVGVFSFGGIGIGVFSFGGISLAAFVAFGGAAFSGLLSIGGVAISYIASLGGVAVAKYIAYGGYARANIAIGGVAKGIVAVFNQYGTGKYMFKSPVNEDEVINAIRQVYPKIGKGLLNFLLKTLSLN